jgi:hypothetical protein
MCNISLRRTISIIGLQIALRIVFHERGASRPSRRASDVNSTVLETVKRLKRKEFLRWKFQNVRNDMMAFTGSIPFSSTNKITHFHQ